MQFRNICPHQSILVSIEFSLFVFNFFVLPTALTSMKNRMITTFDDILNKKSVVYTVTFHGVLNIGAVLQAYALQKYITSLGYISLIVNYTPVYFLWQKYRPAKGINKTIKKYRKIFLFNRFAKNHLKLSGRPFTSPNAIGNLVNAYALVCGSDQIWNKSLTKGKLDPAFLLDTDLECKKIAYAASSGGNSLLSESEQSHDCFRKYDALGVRENHLQSELQKIGCTSPVATVVDPTFLIADYKDILDNKHLPSYSYIVTYEVSAPASRRQFDSTVQQIKKLTNLPTVHLGVYPISSADICLDVLTPGQWLALIKGANLVCTNSFHGLAISLNFKKNVIVVPHLEDNRNERSISLLRRSKLEHLLCTDIAALDASNIFNSYDTLALDSFINESKFFLKTALL